MQWLNKEMCCNRDTFKIPALPKKGCVWPMPRFRCWIWHRWMDVIFGSWALNPLLTFKDSMLCWLLWHSQIGAIFSCETPKWVKSGWHPSATSVRRVISLLHFDILHNVCESYFAQKLSGKKLDWISAVLIHNCIFFWKTWLCISDNIIDLIFRSDSDSGH